MSDEYKIIKGVWDSLDKEDNEAYRQDQSHWRGVGRWMDDERWQAIGKSTLAKLRAFWQSLNKAPFPDPLVMLEWGPGGGSNVFGMRRHAQRYFGVDISESNLAECQRMISKEGYGGIFTPIHLESDPSSVVDLISEPLDVFLSTAVFQHFPSKQYGADVLAAIHKMSKPGALGIVQIRYDNGSEKYRPIADLSEYKERHITANSYQIDEFWKLLQTTGFQPQMIRDINPATNYATFYFKKA